MKIMIEHELSHLLRHTDTQSDNEIVTKPIHLSIHVFIIFNVFQHT